MFPARKTIREIVDEKNTPIAKEQIFVIEPLNVDFNSDKISLVNKKLKGEYDRIHFEIDKKKEDFLKKLKSFCGLKKISMRRFRKHSVIMKKIFSLV